MDALDAATRCVQEFGLNVEDPVVLRATKNTVVWLKPLPIVAKVDTGHYGRLEVEIDVARRLAVTGAPVVAPAEGIPPGVHRAGFFEMTFWRYHSQATVAEPESGPVAEVLAELHEALRRLSPGVARGGRFDDELHVLERRLDDGQFAPELGANDRHLLRGVIADGLGQLRAQSWAERTLHGSPHRLNILVVDGSPRFIDFETVCQGPLEWDLAHLEAGVAAHYPFPVSEEVLKTCGLLVSAKTAAWCWHSIHTGPDMRFHANLHLQAVREATS